MANVDLDAAIVADSSVAASAGIAYAARWSVSADSSVAGETSVVFSLTSDVKATSTLSAPLSASLSLASNITSGSNLTFPTQSFIAADSVVVADLSYLLQTSIVGNASMASETSIAYQFAAPVVADSGVSANLGVVYSAASSLASDSAVAAYWGQFLSGEADGAAIVTGNIGTTIPVSGSVHGTSTVFSPISYITILVSGQAVGIGTLLDESVLDLSGTALGQGVINAALLSNDHLLSGLARGVGSMLDTGPLPIYGTGVLVGLLDVEKVPLPVCPPPVLPQFRWGYMFTLGDLQLKITDTTGNPMSPYEVTYTMYRVLPSGLAVQAGPLQRPVQQNVGVYYVAGVAGENGQPGNWLVRWSYRRTFAGTPTTVDMPFVVVDSVSSPVPGDQACRVKKYGWW